MGAYKYDNNFHQRNDALFDLLIAPGAAPPCAGIYRCEFCGNEVVSEKSKLPPAAS